MAQVSVILPTFKQANFIRRALESLQAQTFHDWELSIIDDGSPDDTYQAVASYLGDPRIQYRRLERNRGLGAALNIGLSNTTAPLVAYLPSDDVYYAGHLASLVHMLAKHEEAVLACSGVRHHYNRFADGRIEGNWLQLVQVMHRRTGDTWMEREELVTDDLDRMFWNKLRRHGDVVETNDVTCEWVDHPHQRHKLLREPVGGLNTYRSYYDVKRPLRMHTSVGNHIDEVEYYRQFRRRSATSADEALTILLVGELAYNPERMLALEERGHKLYGLWMTNPYWYNTVGPLPFGHVEDLPRENWRDAVRRLQPDVIYALLNWQAVPFAHQVLQADLGIPFIWHFKEGPFICLEKGTWSELIDLYLHADGTIYCSPEMREWFYTVVPALNRSAPSLVLDGDLPKREWFTSDRSERLSRHTDGFHTVVPGRPIGLHPHTVAELADQNIHLHFYGDFTHGEWRKWIESTRKMAPDHIHLHSHVDQRRWVSEFSQYDAGWLHYFESSNNGEIRRADWDDLNYPARIATLVAAGLPVLQRDNAGSSVATQSLVREFDIGLFFTSMSELREQLECEERMTQLRHNVWRHRDKFTFDYHADRLIAFFRKTIAHRQYTNE